MLKLTFLGTSSGVPTRTRNVSGLVVQRTGHTDWILVDAGEGTQQRLQQIGLSLHNLSLVCITHVHGDHCYGLPGLLASAGLSGRTSPLTLVGPSKLLEWWSATQALTDLHLPYQLNLIDVASSYQIWNSGQNDAMSLQVSRHALTHRVPSYAYRFEANQERRNLRSEALHASGLPQGPLWGALQRGQSVVYQNQTWHAADWLDSFSDRAIVVVAGDNAQPSRLRAACAGAHLLVHEATYTQAVLDKVGSASMHSSAQEVARFAQTAGIAHLVLTHLSPRFHQSTGETELINEARAHFNGNIWLARDGDVLRIDEKGGLHIQENLLQPTLQSPENNNSPKVNET